MEQLTFILKSLSQAVCLKKATSQLILALFPTNTPVTAISSYFHTGQGQVVSI